MEVMRIDLAVPDHTTLARRRRTVDVRDHRWPRKGPVDLVIDSTGLTFFGAGEWARAKHGETRRSWRKLHLSVNPDDNEIIAQEDLTHELTDDGTADAAMIRDLVASSGGDIRTVIADGAYDGAPVYQAIRAARPGRSPPRIVIPPGKASMPAKGEPHGGSEREAALRRDCGPWANGLAATPRIRQTLIGRDGYRPHQTDQRRASQLPNFWRPADRSRHSHQDRQPQHEQRKTSVGPRPLRAPTKSALRSLASLHQSLPVDALSTVL
jgi:hypothetical protein